jgi:hypothetical protein
VCALFVCMCHWVAAAVAATRITQRTGKDGVMCLVYCRLGVASVVVLSVAALFMLDGSLLVHCID